MVIPTILRHTEQIKGLKRRIHILHWIVGAHIALDLMHSWGWI